MTRPFHAALPKRVMEDITDTSLFVLRQRLQGFILSNPDVVGAGRLIDPISDWSFDEMNCIVHFVGFTWVTFGDGRSPRAIGLRYLGQSGGWCSYEIALFIRIGEIERSRWRFRSTDGWSFMG